MKNNSNCILNSDNIHVYPYGNNMLILNTENLRCINIALESYNSIIEGDCDQETDETLKLVLGFNELANEELVEDDFVIHEVQLGIHTKCNLKCKYCFREYNHQNSSEQIGRASCRERV